MEKQLKNEIIDLINIKYSISLSELNLTIPPKKEL